MNIAKFSLLSGALLAFLGVAAGAFGGHALKERLAAADLAIFEVGVRYHMYHALALVALAPCMQLLGEEGLA
ncbi:MAG: DUF423 domain-containing protein, partial [Chlamydiia bacterium]|nr:DUF423 domain-containing protein [Chlamydiia bacterium]